MTIEKIKKNIYRSKGKDVKIVCRGSRNKKEIYDGKIDEIYNYIFTIKSYDNSTKSFSYCDVLTNTVKIYNNNRKITKMNW